MDDDGGNRCVVDADGGGDVACVAEEAAEGRRVDVVCNVFGEGRKDLMELVIDFSERPEATGIGHCCNLTTTCTIQRRKRKKKTNYKTIKT